MVSLLALTDGCALCLHTTYRRLIIIHQQKSGLPLMTQATQIFQKYGISALGRGIVSIPSNDDAYSDIQQKSVCLAQRGTLVWPFAVFLLAICCFPLFLKAPAMNACHQVPAIGRETLYAAGYLGLFPVLKAHLDENYSHAMSPGARLAVAGITGGFFGAIASHPFDTIKTKMQARGEGPGGGGGAGGRVHVQGAGVGMRVAVWGFNDGSGPPLLRPGQVPAPCVFLKNREGAAS